MALSQNQTVSILYDLAMAMAGETRSRPLAMTMLQHFLSHTGCGCGAILLDAMPAGSVDAGTRTAEVYAAIGNRHLRALEGQTAEWPLRLLQGIHAESSTGWFPGGSKYSHALHLELPGLGHILLFSALPPSEAVQQVVTLFPPILSKFTCSLRLCLDGEAHEMTLAVARDAAEEGSRAKSAFMASMSHELRTPLNAILGYAQLMEMNTGLPERALMSAREIRIAGTQLLALVNDVLDLTRIESGNLDLKVEYLDLDDVLAECLAQNRGAAEAQKIALTLSSHCHALQICADYHRLLQVLNNLVSNAIKFNRENGSVGVSCTSSANGQLRIAIKDSGLGIAHDKQAQLFQPFNRLGVEMGVIEGTGIGLVITRQLVESMGGHIGVESSPGTGSTFWVELPLSSREESVPDAPPSSGIRAENNSLQGTRVLVAEDYEPNQAVLRMQLASLGCDVEIVPDGAVALERWIEGRHELILTDLNMPVMDGLAFAQAVRLHERNSGRHTPMIAITAAAEPSELQRCRDAGMDDVLTKPVMLEGLRNILIRWAGFGEQLNEAPAAPEEDQSGKKAAEVAILDIDHLYHILGQASLEHARELVGTFIRSASDGLESLSAKAGDGVALAREMHKQKSSARTVGALRFAACAELLEQQAREGNRVVSLDLLREALAEVKLAAANLEVGQQGSITALPQGRDASPTVHCEAVLIVDDDAVVLQQMVAMLNTLGVKEVLTAGNGLEAIRKIGDHDGKFDALVCDLNMPEMDGVELIRMFGRTGFHGGLILMSGAGEKILSTVSELAGLQGLHVLGQVQKPVMPGQMAALLAHLGASPARKFENSVAPEISPATIREGIARDEFTIWFQPKVDAVTLAPVGVEALARWRRLDGSFVPPDVFITVAEMEGLIGELSQILASKALKEGARLHGAGFPLKISVNLSGRWLNNLSLPDFIMATAQDAGLRASDVILEVTETGVMEDLTTALDVLTRIRLKGFGLSIDDFGIGYSSFEQLGRIPFTELKLDRSFVSRGNQDPSARAILEGSMDMARKLGLSTVAEGVETEEDLKLVRMLGCGGVQGYLIAKPMPVENLITWLRGARDKAISS